MDHSLQDCTGYSGGVVVSTVDTGAGISVFFLVPAIFVYNYLRAPDQSR